MQDFHSILFPYAYNILGSIEDAKDAIQDVLSNYYAKEHSDVENEKNYLIKSVINQAINLKQKRKKLVDGDVWLPAPVATETADNHLHLENILSYSLLILLENLNAKERAIFILKESFDYSHEEIATLFDTTVENSRKILSRAKAKLFKPSEARTVPVQHAQMSFLEKYMSAFRERDMQQIESLLADDILYYADGGANAKVAAKFAEGQLTVRDLLVFVYDKFLSQAEAILTEVNHQPAILYKYGGAIRACQVFDLSEDGKILRINNVVDSTKIQHLIA
ncbi:RNA polymerase sigma-70 factor (ECF subfamily) [Chitinophaga skermanii]|uniref:RNA polymerase sigma-70 factor (ECF subfamily) n=1 Tax=Chitinophaga skermanii TaxID=331697 RepID=A0A327Q7S1_9BACT|nr:sigma-70 family RNA polymerase sigma factor [Chitinophaga skermanii]RAJ00351.1 RNA polymerase sigma-70 factor (ECF subfamily) [Chitinophaga skermanii]